VEARRPASSSTRTRKSTHNHLLLLPKPPSPSFRSISISFHQRRFPFFLKILCDLLSNTLSSPLFVQPHRKCNTFSALSLIPNHKTSFLHSAPKIPLLSHSKKKKNHLSCLTVVYFLFSRPSPCTLSNHRPTSSFLLLQGSSFAPCNGSLPPQPSAL